MNSRLLIDAIVRQSMVLIAQLSTVDGARSALSHVADEVFVNLVRELEAQGLGKKIIADMFGLALRSYRQKVQRLTESVTTRGVTLWGAIHGYLSEHESASRTDLLTRFKYDEERTIRGILNDLVESGLVFRVGRGTNTRYRVATPEELEDLGMTGNGDSPETSQTLVWLHVCREGPLDKEALKELLPLDKNAIDEALADLVAQNRVRVISGGDQELYTTEQCLIRVGESAGWEASVIDHHRAVLTALAAKIVRGPHTSAAQDEIGGTTLSFDLWRGHPLENEVRQLLAETRKRIITMWDAVEGHNATKAHPIEYNVTFYCGQYLTGDGENE
jgi:hypothetical protein